MHKKLLTLTFCFIQYTNINKVDISLVLHNKDALLMRRYSEHKHSEQKPFRKVWTRYVLNFDQTLMKRCTSDDSDETVIWLPCYRNRSFSIFSNIFGRLCDQIFYSWIRFDLK